mgnify:CR=1 FL=1
MPLQSGSDRILKEMRRSYRSEKYLGILERVREAIPDAAITTDIIVGFPGETQEDYDDLANFISAAKLDAIGIFGYSDEDNTEALGLDEKLDEDLIKERVENLSRLADEMVSMRAAARIGETVRVLIEDEELQEGRAAHQGPEVDGTTSFIGTNFKVGQYIDAVVIESMGADLVGMSTVPEAIAAHALGAEVLGISLVTNAAAGITGEKLNHEEVIAAGKAAADRIGALLKSTIPKLI